MQIPIRMCDERLAPFVDVYGHWLVAMEDISTPSPGLIAFNLSGTRLEVNGQPRKEPVLMGIANEPALVTYSMGGGDIVSLRVRGHTYDRLLGIDPSIDQGVVAMDLERHPKLAAIYEQLKAAPRDSEALFQTLDRALLALLPDAKSDGLVGEMIALVSNQYRAWTVAEICDRLGCKVRTLERACKRRYGRTPKRLLRGHRLNRTMQMEQESEERVELQADFAYADLPHYLNDMRGILGLNRNQMRDGPTFGLDFPYRYLWPDGSEAASDGEITAWQDEMTRRIREFPG